MTIAGFENFKKYLLLDAARRSANIAHLRLFNTHQLSLYKGRTSEALEDFSPVLFSFEPPSDFTEHYFTRGWGDAWGILLFSNAGFDEIYTHLRKFIIVKMFDGRELYFRFHDPRVLRVFLPTCTPAQLREFFGPVLQFIMEDEIPQFALRFWLENNELKKERFPSKELIGKARPASPGISDSRSDVIGGSALPNQWID